MPRRKPGKRVPFDAPGFALSAPVVRAFNAAYWRRVPATGRTVVKPITDFFFPLDRIRDWNRLYGRAGFHQFQCVVPDRRVEALRAMLERIAEAGIASPLAVLKRMGPGRAGMLSFPMQGYTLAVDFPNRGQAAPLIAELHAMTEAAEGRIYLAKDSLLGPARMARMYPELDAWRAVVAAGRPRGADADRHDPQAGDAPMTETWIVLGASSSMARAFARAVAERGGGLLLAGRDGDDLAGIGRRCGAARRRLCRGAWLRRPRPRRLRRADRPRPRLRRQRQRRGLRRLDAAAGRDRRGSGADRRHGRPTVSPARRGSCTCWRR